MRKKGFFLPILIAFLGMLLFVGSVLLSQKADLSLVAFQDSRHNLTLSPYYDAASETYYLFLPGFTQPEDIVTSHSLYAQVRFSQEVRTLSDGERAEVSVALLWGGRQTFSLEVKQCSAEQTVYLEAQDGVLEDLHSDQTKEREIFVTLLDSQGSQIHTGSALLSGRGNGTWAYEKKPYDLNLSTSVTFGAFQDVEKLCLLAEYFDISKLRNAFGYTLGQIMEIDYASPYQYADVFLNGEYLGLYGIATKGEYEKHIEEDGIQAVFELTPYHKGDPYYTESGMLVRHRYGDSDQIYDAVYALEKALLEQDWNALLKIIDLDSWAEKYALEEFLNNYDMGLASQYFWLDSSGKICCMLPWDYEWIFYSRIYPYDLQEEYSLSANWYRDSWYSLMLECPQFRDRVASVWETSYTTTLFQELENQMYLWEQEISGSYTADGIRWANSYRNSHTILPGTLPLSHYRDQFASSFIPRRNFLISLLRDWDNYCLISFQCSYGETLDSEKMQLILPVGTDLTLYHSRIALSMKPEEGWALAGLFTEDGQPMESVTTLTEDITFIARYRPLTQEETP